MGAIRFKLPIAQCLHSDSMEAEIARRAAEARNADARWQLFERAEDELLISELRSALNRTELTFHRVEAGRVMLAKHEIPRTGAWVHKLGRHPAASYLWIDPPRRSRRMT
jgi:hypothetical protein